MKKFHFGKKQAVLTLMVLLLGAAVYLNYYVATKSPLTTQTDTASTSTTETTAAPLGESQFVNNTTAAPQDHFTLARADREAAREEALAILQDTLQDVKLDEAAQKEALEAAAAVAIAVEQESAVENLVKAKGFEDCVAYIEDDYCHVTVSAASLTEAQTLQIAEIVIAQTDVSPANINIMPVE